MPNVWNLGDDSPASMIGGVGWYRKDFSLPEASRALAWAVRFESVNYRSRVWLNGKRVGSNRGAYIPFELRLSGLKRRGTNRLVIRVDSKRRSTDFPPSGLATNGTPTGGWWNYSGLQREVYLKRLNVVDWKSVRVTPLLACARCTATVRVRVTLRNVRPGAQRVRVTGNFGSRRIDLGTRGIPGNGVTSFNTSFRMPRPRVWSPAKPNLYNVNLRASAGGRAVSSYKLRTGIRSIRVSGDGHLILNGARVNLRGVGVHEDSKAQGFAVDNAFRKRLVAETKAVGATMMRTHYPMHPYTHELADRQGVMIWSEVPVYAIKTANLAKNLVTTLAAKELEKNIIANQNHPSVLIWSIANELSSRPGPTQASYIKNAVRQAKRLDPSRPVGLAVAGYPAVGCQNKAYAPLDVIGVNEYFGWYPGPQGSIFDRTQLSAYLDQLRAVLPEAGPDGHGVRRRGQPRRPGRGEGHVGLPAGLRELPSRRLRAEAVAQRRALLGAQRVPRAPGLGGRQPAPDPAAAPEGPAPLRRLLTQARLVGPAAQLRRDEAVRLAPLAPHGAALRRRLARRAARALRREVAQALVGAQPDRRRDRVGQRQAAGR